MAYNYITLGQAQNALAARLGDNSFQFWNANELTLYINEALRYWNCLTAWYVQDWTVTLVPPVATNWQSTNVTGSPRQQSVTDTDVYTLIEYHLLEPPTGGVWAGTSQYSIADLQNAVQRIRDEVLQVSGCNMQEAELNLTPNTNVLALSDTTLDVRRVRYISVDSTAISTLNRSDGLAYQRFSPGYQQSTGTPLRWDLLDTSPLTLLFDQKPNQPNTVQVLYMQSGSPLNPPAATALQVPNDWMWVVKFGALGDILEKENEGKDAERAAYSKQRYREGLKLMEKMPWVLEAFVNEIPTDTPAVASSDSFNYEWQSNPNAFPGIVVGGIDLWAPSPIPATTTGYRLRLVANAPLPVQASDQIQLPRDAMDAVLNEAQHLAAFKEAGIEFQHSLALHKSFLETAMRYNARLKVMGIFESDVRPVVPRQEEVMPRFAVEGKQ